MRMPYQCMTRCGDVLVAARGSSIDTFKLADGSILSTWRYPSSGDGQDSTPIDDTPELTTKLASQKSDSSSVDIALHSESPPAKKRKLSQSEQTSTETKATNGKEKQNNRSAAVASGLEAPAVIFMVSTTDGKHVIAVTGEDKSIRVFENTREDGKHQLKQLSQRSMPKRPCTLVITEDNSTIISADKFGDVYALPLLPAEDAATIQTQAPERQPSKIFIPAANELTIHSQRNRKALENQKRHGNKAPERSEPTFEHKLLLGHVSMLTDVALGISGNKNYILTADRDEHIRISRSVPQSHIIEGFCLGHTEFVSRLCIPESKPNLLISAGGDDEIFIWDWTSRRLISRTNLQKHVEALKMKLGEGDIVEASTEPVKIAVSGLYHMQGYVDDRLTGYIIATCEGIPALFLFHLDYEQSNLRHLQTFELPGNPLALVTDAPLPAYSHTDSLIVSIDTVHQPASTAERRTGASTMASTLLGLRICNRGIVHSNVMFNMPTAEDVREDTSAGRLSNLFYNLENLRKRDGEGQEE